jgi:hypothetical protein
MSSVTSRPPDLVRLPSIWRHARTVLLLFPVASGAAQADPVRTSTSSSSPSALAAPMVAFPSPPLFARSNWEGLGRQARPCQCRARQEDEPGDLRCFSMSVNEPGCGDLTAARRLPAEEGDGGQATSTNKLVVAGRGDFTVANELLPCGGCPAAAVWRMPCYRVLRRRMPCCCHARFERTTPEEARFDGHRGPPQASSCSPCCRPLLTLLPPCAAAARPVPTICLTKYLKGVNLPIQRRLSGNHDYIRQPNTL